MSDPATWTQQQRLKVAMVYEAMARLLPVEGTDYKLAFSFDRADGGLRVAITGLTPFGNLWAEYCEARLRASFGVNNTSNTTENDTRIVVI